MPIINFNSFGNDFQSAINNLENAFRASDAVFAQKTYEASAAVVRWQAGEDQPEHLLSQDEDDERNYALIFAAHEFNVSWGQVREAFIVMLHHTWERHVKRWVGANNYKIDFVDQFLLDYGIETDRSTLKELADIANSAKHGNETKYFNDSDMINFFNAVRKSGLMSNSIRSVER